MWHILANGETELLTFVHAFESCNQESSTVLAIIDDVFCQLKEIMPEVSSVYMRSDNAGCYHCAFTLLSVYHVASEQAIELKRFGFPTPKAEKDLVIVRPPQLKVTCAPISMLATT